MDALFRGAHLLIELELKVNLSLYLTLSSNEIYIIKVLALEFPSCSFCWVQRDANGMAHSFAKSASSLPSCFSCNSSNLPPSVHET